MAAPRKGRPKKEIMAKPFIFDLDGTFVLRKNDGWIRDLLVLWLKRNGIDDPRIYIDDPRWSDRSQRAALFGISQEKYEIWNGNFARVEYDNFVSQTENNQIYLAEGTIELLESIPEPKLLVSNACKEWVNYAADFFGIRKYFDYIFERDYRFGQPKKPDPRMKDILTRHTGLLIDGGVVVGDTASDSEFAANLNCKFISVYNKLIKSDFSFRDINQLKDNIADIRKKI